MFFCLFCFCVFFCLVLTEKHLYCHDTANSLLLALITCSISQTVASVLSTTSGFLPPFPYLEQTEKTFPENGQNSGFALDFLISLEESEVIL